MAKFHVSTRELKRSFNRLRGHCTTELESPVASRPAAAALLVGLYAVECGLKLLLLADRGIHHTSYLADDDDFFSHDPNFLLDLLGQPPRFRASTAQQPEGVHVATVQLHELYRYGGLLPPAHEAALQRNILEVLAFIEDNAP